MAFIPILPARSTLSSRQCSTVSPQLLPVRRRATTRNLPARMCEGSSQKDEDIVPLSALNDLRSPPASPTTSTPSSVPDTKQPVEEEDLRSEKQKEIDRLRAAEKFISIDEGKYECQACGYMYEPQNGERRASISPGTRFEDLPDSFTCPVCRSPRNRFISVKKVIAGFAENQQYGFGSNAMTEGQKNLLIFGGLALAFLLLLSGYALN